jgi:hypothetical protein
LTLDFFAMLSEIALPKTLLKENSPILHPIIDFIILTFIQFLPEYIKIFLLKKNLEIKLFLEKVFIVLLNTFKEKNKGEI